MAAALGSVGLAAAAPPTKTAPAKAAPAKAPVKLTPAQARAADLRAGATLFANSGSGACHTLAGARAVGRAGPDLDVLGLPAAEIARQLTKDSIAIPSFKNRLSAAQIAQLAGYIAATAKARGTRPRDALVLLQESGRVSGSASLGVGGVWQAARWTSRGRRPSSVWCGRTVLKSCR